MSLDAAEPDPVASPGPSAVPADDGLDAGAPTEPPGHPVAAAVGIGAGIAGSVYMLVAATLYLLASVDPNGRDRPFVRTGLTVVGPLVAVVAGVVVATAWVIWRRRGGRWEWDRRPTPYD